MRAKCRTACAELRSPEARTLQTLSSVVSPWSSYVLMADSCNLLVAAELPWEGCGCAELRRFGVPDCGSRRAAEPGPGETARAQSFEPSGDETTWSEKSLRQQHGSPYPMQSKCNRATGSSHTLRDAGLFLCSCSKTLLTLQKSSRGALQRWTAQLFFECSLRAV